MRHAVPSVFRIAALAVLLGIAPLAAPATEPTFHYVYLFNGKPAGKETHVWSAGTAVDVDFEYNDRGRGPKIHARYAFGQQGLPVAVDVSGVNYLKAPVDEHLKADGGRWQWRSSGEHGESTSAGFYISNEGAGGLELAELARACARVPGGRLALLPTGQAQLEQVAETTVESHGQRLHLRELALTGLSFTPLTVWVDDDGYAFAQPGPWQAWLRAGWEDVNDALFAIQNKEDETRYTRLAKSLARQPGHPVAIEHVRVFDSEAASSAEDQTVIVEGSRILSVGPAASAQVPADAERVDGRGRTLLPGLFDMHLHIQADQGLLNVASGVTSGRDMGNGIDMLGRLATQYASGEAIGPTIWKAGLIDGPGPFQAPTGIFADTPAEVEAAVNRYADLGYVQIKLYSSLKPELVPVAAAAAHRRGLRLSGHVPNGMVAADFVRAGADELQHINFIFLNFLAGKVKDTRTPERFTAVAENAAGLDLDGPEVRDFIALLLAHHTTFDPTLVAFEDMFLGRPGEASPSLVPILDRLPAQVRRSAYAGGLPVTAANDQRYKDAFAAALRMTKKLYDADVPILVGTDNLPGFALHHHLELEVQAGIPAARALQDATLLAARVLKTDASLGSIRPGKQADLLLVEGNPLVRISDIRRGRLVMKAGVLYDPAKLYAANGIAPAP
jgi:imidazolonepropionase-like amidohydrolase